MNDITIYGAGGFGREVACMIEQINREKPIWNLLGFFDDGLKKGTQEQYGKVLGGMDELNHWPKPLSVVIAIGKPSTLRAIAEKIVNPMVDFPNIIAPGVCFMDYSSVTMGKGNLVCPNALISCNVKIGDFNMINVYTQIGHETRLGNYNIVMPSVNLSGGLQIGDLNMFGVKATVTQYRKIGDGVVIAPGAVLMRNAKDGKIYSGNPAKIFM